MVAWISNLNLVSKEAIFGFHNWFEMCLALKRSGTEKPHTPRRPSACKPLICGALSRSLSLSHFLLWPFSWEKKSKLISQFSEEFLLCPLTKVWAVFVVFVPSPSFPPFSHFLFWLLFVFVEFFFEAESIFKGIKWRSQLKWLTDWLTKQRFLWLVRQQQRSLVVQGDYWG